MHSHTDRERLSRARGIVAVGTADEPLRLDSGRELSHAALAYETYGRLNAARDNAIMVCHALTGSAHAAGLDDEGTRGWWDGLIGPGRALDTERYYIVCANVLGGCYGSTGPASLDPQSGVRYGDAFPTITIRDIVRAQRRLVALLGIRRIKAAIGGSMGGMQALEWGALYPELVERIIPIATSAAQSAWCIALNAVAREAIALGRAAGDGDAGLRLARKVGMISYRSDVEFAERFGRSRAHDGIGPVDGTFDVEHYLERHGRTLVARFDAATYATLSRAMDLHDLGRDRGSLDDALASIGQPALCIGISSDIRYPASEQRALAAALRHGRYAEVDSICGHDAFLIELDQIGGLFTRFFEETADVTVKPTTNETLCEID